MTNKFGGWAKAVSDMQLIELGYPMVYLRTFDWEVSGHLKADNFEAVCHIYWVVVFLRRKTHFRQLTGLEVGYISPGVLSFYHW